MAIYLVTWDFSTTIRDKAQYESLRLVATLFCAGFTDSVKVMQTCWAVETDRDAVSLYDDLFDKLIRQEQLIVEGDDEARDRIIVQRLDRESQNSDLDVQNWMADPARRW